MPLYLALAGAGAGGYYLYRAGGDVGGAKKAMKSAFRFPHNSGLLSPANTFQLTPRRLVRSCPPVAMPRRLAPTTEKRPVRLSMKLYVPPPLPSPHETYLVLGYGLNTADQCRSTMPAPSSSLTRRSPRWRRMERRSSASLAKMRGRESTMASIRWIALLSRRPLRLRELRLAGSRARNNSGWLLTSCG